MIYMSYKYKWKIIPVLLDFLKEYLRFNWGRSIRTQDRLSRASKEV